MLRLGFSRRASSIQLPVRWSHRGLGRISAGNFVVVTSRHRLQPEQESCVRQHGSSGTRTRIVCEAIRVVGRTAPVAVVAGGALKHQSGHRECHRQRKRKGGRRDGVNRHQSATDKGKGKEGEDCEIRSALKQSGKTKLALKPTAYSALTAEGTVIRRRHRDRLTSRHDGP